MSRLKPDIVNALLHAKRVGAYNIDACKACGISERTLYVWLERGRKAKSGKYYDFVIAFDKAEAKGSIMDLALIAQAAKNGSWPASAWRLERRYPLQFSLRPERFANDERLRLEAKAKAEGAAQPTTQTLEALLLELVEDLPPDSARDLLDALRRRRERNE